MFEPRRSHPRFVFTAILVCVCAGTYTMAAELTGEATRAYENYQKSARDAFLSRVGSNPGAVAKNGAERSVRPGKEDGIISVPGGLLHHWVGGTFIPHATLEHAVEVSASYANYTAIYKEVIASTLVAHEGDTYRVILRLKEGQAGITAVLDVHSTIQFVHASSGLVYSITNADEIREIENPAKPSERLLPAGRDSGYLWRASTFTAFIARSDGVYVETESLGLSRRFPAFSSWLIEPIARRLGRKSIEGSLQEFAAAVQKGS
jgi:hypothetical protein